MVGAGAIGGYFGGRLIENGTDVTFLVRKNRKEQLDRDGLMVDSIHGNINLKVKTLLAGEKAEPFDVIFLSTKAYHLHGAIDSIQPYTCGNTVILPLLNGISHVSSLIEAFGEERVLGGLCFIETTLDTTGTVIQTSPIHDLVFGERNGEKTERILKLQDALAGTKAFFRLSENIEQDMWHKYLFISTLSGATSLFRSPIGPIRSQKHGLQMIRTVLHEAASIMRAMNAPILGEIEEAHLTKINEMSYDMKSSLQRDMEKQMPIEAEHFFGYLLDLAQDYDIQAPYLEMIYANLKIYENSCLQEQKHVLP